MSITFKNFFSLDSALLLSRKMKQIKDLFKNFTEKKDLYLIVENADWIIKDIGLKISFNLNNIPSKVTTIHLGIRNSIVHYVSENMLLGRGKLRLAHRSNKIVVSWFHVVPQDKRLGVIPQAVKYVNLWHTASSITKDKLLDLGVPLERIVIIPLGIDLKHFNKAIEEEKNNIKNELGLPNNKIIIGSFQKDGVGWGEGLEPKLIKGPDVFCDVIRGLSKKYDIFVLLTGPARGYVKKRLAKENIPYLHHYFSNSNEISKYYKAIDLYLITSRVEGGPSAILESLASGVPLVTTKAGMAVDVIKDGENGFIAEVEDTQDLIQKSSRLIGDNLLREKFISKGLQDVKRYDWSNIVGEYYEKIYKKILNSAG
jgi:glycosyltransferase involved in cell wall biosynthesis